MKIGDASAGEREGSRHLEKNAEHRPTAKKESNKRKKTPLKRGRFEPGAECQILTQEGPTALPRLLQDKVAREVKGTLES